MANERPAKGKESDRRLLKDLRKRFKDALDSDETQRRDAMEDMKFATIPGYQWDENQKKERGKRPCYEFNKIRVTGKRIINNMRDNRPAGKVRGTEDNDKDNAEIYEGLIRNIWARNGDNVMDYAAEQAVKNPNCWVSHEDCLNHALHVIGNRVELNYYDLPVEYCYCPKLSKARKEAEYSADINDVRIMQGLASQGRKRKQ